MASSFDVVIVGGGGIGASAAYFISLDGASVCLIDKGPVAREASWASAGMIGPSMPRGYNPWYLETSTLSKTLYDRLHDELTEVTGRRFVYGGKGMFYTAHTEGEADAARGEAKYQAANGVAAEFLPGDECRRREPALREDVIGALYKAEGRYLEAGDYTATVATAARAKGAEVREGVQVIGLVWEGDVVTGVRTAEGPISAGLVINAAGAWAGGIDPRLTHPVRPLHGQIMSVEAPPEGLRHNVSRIGAHGYVTPRPDGRVIVGATEDDWGYAKKLTPDGLELLSHISENLLPQLSNAAILNIWSGLRPVTPDGLPAIGPDPRTSGGFVWAAGHSTTGMLAAPATAVVLSDLAAGREPRIPLKQVLIDRFLN